ncbi:MAG: hypothetical protein M1831_002482 [Alyxoria varia]|nr:MAG: hypothetical protein M1831_002482 [Alyxoria varia]
MTLNPTTAYLNNIIDEPATCCQNDPHQHQPALTKRYQAGRRRQEQQQHGTRQRQSESGAAPSLTKRFAGKRRRRPLLAHPSNAESEPPTRRARNSSPLDNAPQAGSEPSPPPHYWIDRTDYTDFTIDTTTTNILADYGNQQVATREQLFVRMMHQAFFHTGALAAEDFAISRNGLIQVGDRGVIWEWIVQLPPRAWSGLQRQEQPEEAEEEEWQQQQQDPDAVLVPSALEVRAPATDPVYFPVDNPSLSIFIWRTFVKPWRENLPRAVTDATFVHVSGMFEFSYHAFNLGDDADVHGSIAGHPELQRLFPLFEERRVATEQLEETERSIAAALEGLSLSDLS